MPRFHNINGQRVQYTPEEEAARDAEEAAALPEMEAEQRRLRRRRRRLQRMRAKGWEDWSDFLMDMATRTPVVVLAELKAEFDAADSEEP